MNRVFEDRAKLYFKENSEKFIEELSKDNIGVKADVTITDDIYSKLLEHMSVEYEPVSIGIRCISNIDKESNIVSSVTNIHSLYIVNNCIGDKVSFTDKK